MKGDDNQSTNPNALQKGIDKISSNTPTSTVEGNIALLGTILSKVIGFFTRTGAPQQGYLRKETIKAPKIREFEEVMKKPVEIGSFRGTTKNYEQLIAEMQSNPKKGKALKKKKGKTKPITQKDFDNNAPEDLKKLMDLAKEYKENNHIIGKILGGVKAHSGDKYAQKVENYATQRKRDNDQKFRQKNRRKQRGREL